MKKLFLIMVIAGSVMCATSSIARESNRLSNVTSGISSTTSNTVNFVKKSVTPNNTKKAFREGSTEFGISADFDKETVTGSSISSDVFLGKFVFDGIMFGVGGGVTDDDLGTDWKAALRSELNLGTVKSLVPFIGAGANYVSSDRVGDQNTWVLDLNAGVKFFLANNVALALRGVYEIADDNIFANANNGTVEDNNLGADAGLRFYF